MDGIREFVNDFHLYGLVVFVEVTLRLLLWATHDETGHPRFRFLAPIFFCSIVPVFYLGLYGLDISIEEAGQMGYMFPDAVSQCDETTAQCVVPSFQEKGFDGHVLDMFRAFDFRLIDWHDAWNAMGVVLALVSFSLIHVPITIPAFAVSSNISGDVDINKELMAHGYSNALAGLFGGLQNVMTYSFSVLFMKSGGRGVASSMTIAAITALMFVYGPAVAMMFPRCMAGTLLLHIGLDLFLEGVVDSLGKFDRFEYCGIWLITLSMTLHGMTAALLAGLIVALSTFALQSMTNLDPIFRVISAATLRSSAWNRSAEASKILDDKLRGRSRILVVSLQGHLFFGNVADLTDSLKGTLRTLQCSDESPFILLLDFTLVVGMDSSAAHAIAKLKDVIHRNPTLSR
jgi:SulP family sulfate permease